MELSALDKFGNAVRLRIQHYQEKLTQLQLKLPWVTMLQLELRQEAMF